MSDGLLLVGVSTRAAAESAARAGVDVTAVDAFADADQHPGVVAHQVPGRFTPRKAAACAQAIDADAVAYLSPFENHPAVVAAMASGRQLWGNSPDVLRRVRDPQLLAAALERRGFSTPGTTATKTWLLKPLRSGGGQGVRLSAPGERVPRGSYRQPFVSGTPWSIVCVAAGGAMMPLGLSRQLVGDPAFGASGFRYCGSIDEPCAPSVAARAAALARAVVEEFGLVGVNGVDFILSGDQPIAIEVNPRWSASMEVIERATGFPVFAVHAAACRDGVLPANAPAVAGPVAGKAIVFARRRAAVVDNRDWLADPDIRDVPRNGERIAAGKPVCTVFASAPDGAGCYLALTDKARAIYGRLDGWSGKSRTGVKPVCQTMMV